jgi:hypothetical protein
MRFGIEYGIDLGRPLLEADVISFRDAILLEVDFHGRISHANSTIIKATGCTDDDQLH